MADSYTTKSMRTWNSHLYLLITRDVNWNEPRVETLLDSRNTSYVGRNMS
jgi:hypothetical protein